MTERTGFLSAGTWCVDYNKLVPFWPAENGIAEVFEIERRNGGSGSNLAIDMKRLDPEIPVEGMGLVGNDDDGRYLLHEADAYGIDRTRIAVTGEAGTHSTDAYSSKASGKRTHIFYQGTGALLSPDHFDFSGTRRRILHLGLPGVHRKMDAPWGNDPNGWVTVLRAAKSHGLQTNIELPSVDADRLGTLARPCLPFLDMVIVNDHEIGAIAGSATVRNDRTDVDACIEAARQVLAAGSMRFVAVHFPMGAVIVARDGELLRRPSVNVPASAVAAANGAGDAFASGLLYGVHQGWSLDDALALAHAVAAASLREFSTVEGVAPWKECLALAEKWGWRAAI